jgi:lipopolysaccharide/colanic/teichoic acid biosynthesis glycosyltransferase
MKHSVEGSFYQRRGKRFLDVALSLVAVVILSPLLVMLAGLLRVTLGPPVVFRQQRPGLNGMPFTLYKFRSMREPTLAMSGPLPDVDRLSVVGRVLRSTSLDELPELFNVLKGDMSLVGPRPLLMHYLDLYTPAQGRRHEVLPGLTGWAQVNGRNALKWEDRFVFDVWYVDHISLVLDLRIIAMTAWNILRREGVSQPGHATMEEFHRSAVRPDSKVPS